MGVSREEIDTSTPKELEPYENAEKMNAAKTDQLNWYAGMYVMSAVSTALDRAFLGKSSKAEYCENPILADMNLTEEQRYERDLKKALAIEADWARQAALHLPDKLED